MASSRGGRGDPVGNGAKGRGAGRPVRTRRGGGALRSSTGPRRNRPGPPAQRLVALLVALALGMTGILVRLVLLQVKDASALQARALDQRVHDLTFPAQRGAIFDRNGMELALSVPARAVYADPALIRDPRGEATAVATALGLDESAVATELERSGSHFVYLARGVDPAKTNRLAARHLPGIGFLDESRRVYPGGDLASQVLGFVGTDGKGLAGLELGYQTQLAGRPGHEVVQEDPRGNSIPQAASVDVAAVPGTDLVSTIDRQIQFEAQGALAEAVQSNHAKGGSVIAMDPHSGQILAMANYPSFDPNDFSAADPTTYANKAVVDAYEPGSVNKVITAAAAVEDGVLDMNQRLIVPPAIQLYTKVYLDAHPHPTEPMTLGDIIAYSSNVGAIKTAGLIGQFRFASYLYKFGLGMSTGSGFPGESGGILPPPSQWTGTSMGSIPIGQGIAVTPLQMACVYGAIANGGVWVRPSFVRGTIGADGRYVPAPLPVTHRVVSARTARDVSQMLGYGVDVGTGTHAQIPGYWVAGKTGTAHKLLPDGTGYYADKFLASFIGFTPAGRPALVVAAVLDEPATQYGGIAAAPLFQSVAKFALARLRISPARMLPIPPHAIATP